VNARWPEFGRASVSRRTLAKQLAGALLAAAAVRVGVPQTLCNEATHALTRNRPIPPQPKPVVSFFLDQPYLDPSGLGEPYLPPQGLRGGEPLARLTERELRHNAPYGWAIDQNG
jgi:hypothetical protein